MRPFCILAMMLTALPALAEDFRISNEIFAEGQKEPIKRTLTLFKGELVYDFALTIEEGVKENKEKIEQATLYDFTRNRFILVDYTENTKVEIAQDKLLRYLAELTTQVETKDQLLKEAANPKFEITKEEGLIRFTGQRIKYEVTTIVPKTKAAANDYQRFADWSARLTTLQYGPPPKARIVVNEELAKESVIPKQVVLTRSQGPIWENAKKLRSEHLIDWQLTKTDGNRIAALDEKMAELPTISWAEYNAKLAKKKDESKKR